MKKYLYAALYVSLGIFCAAAVVSDGTLLHAVYLLIASVCCVFLVQGRISLHPIVRICLCGAAVNALLESLYDGSLMLTRNITYWLYFIACSAVVCMIFFVIVGAASFYKKHQKAAVNAAYAVTAAAFLVFILINHYFYEFRSQSIMFSDFYAAGTAANVISNYRLEITVSVVFAVFCTALIIAGACLHAEDEIKKTTAPKRSGKWPVGLKFLAAAFVIFYGCLCIEIYAWNTDAATKQFGYAISFVGSIKAHLSADKPDGYSAEEVNETLSAYETEESSEEEAVNIIVVMNESFSDIAELYDIETNIDPLEYFHSLEGDNIRKGSLVVSAYGGGTANTEYEFLTGNSTAFIRTAYPYSEFFSSDTPSLAWLLKNEGYYSTAFHCYLGNGYDRDSVYPAMGFDEFISLEEEGDLVFEEYLRTFLSDSADYKNIIEILESSESEKNFIFNVTMQNHGQYAVGDGSGTSPTLGQGTYDFESYVAVLDESLAEHDDLCEYLTLLDYSDAALEELITYLSGLDEKTILVFFGDHQPLLDDIEEIAEDVFKDDAEAEDAILQYEVPYLIWANFDIDVDFPELLSPNYMRPLVLKAAGISLSAYDEMILEAMEEYPVISRAAVIDSSGEILSADIIDEDELLSFYKKAAYALLFDQDSIDWTLFVN